MEKSNRPAIAALALAFLAGATEANAHARLDSASPAAGSTVNSSLGQVTLHFTEALEPKFSGAEVRSSTGSNVDTGSSASGTTISVGLKNLAPGDYTVTWHVLSVDAHKTKGSFAFHVAK